MAIKEVTDRISPKEYSFDMITLRFDKDLPKFERFGNIDIFRVGMVKRGAKINDSRKFPLFLNKYLYPLWALFTAIILHRHKPYDAIATVMTSHASFAALFFKFLFPKIPYIVRLDDGDPFEHYKKKARITGPLFRQIFTKADFAVTASTYLSGMARAMGYKGEIAIVPNGTSAKHFSQTYKEGELSALKNKLGKNSDEKWMIHTGRLVKKNGLDFVIRALPLLPSSVHFFMIGDGTDRDNLERLATDNGVLSRVHFHSYVPNGELPLYLKSCDIFIRPSLSEGFGISFIEAMAAGVPVIATQEGGIADFLFDPERNPGKEPTGLAVNPRDPEGIARAVRRYIDDPVLKARIVENGKKLAFLKYDWDLIARDMKERVFDRLFHHSA